MSQTVLKPAAQPADHETGVERKVWIAEGLTRVLKDSFVLMVKTQTYHWNITGPMFLSLHQLTEELYRDLFEAIDVIAERVRALGQLAPLSIAELGNAPRIEDCDDNRSAQAMLDQLITDNETLARHLREIAATASRHGDGATEDLLNSRMAAHEKAIWMLRAVAS